MSRKPCPPGCTCGKHRGGMCPTPEQRRAQDLERLRAWRAANVEKIQERNRVNGARNRDRYKYGMPADGRAELFAQQDGCCYLCGEPLDTEAPRGTHVDHDHSCCRGERSCGLCVRGLACDQCNKGIGMFGDDPERMIRVALALRAANEAVAERRAAASVQGEIPLNVRRLERREGSA